MILHKFYNKIVHLIIAIAMASICQNSYANEKHWITIGSDAVQQAQQAQAVIAPSQKHLLASDTEVFIYQIEERQLSNLSRLMHTAHKRCGGYIVHDSYEAALASLQGPITSLAFNAPPIQQQNTVNALLPQVQASEIRNTIASLSNFTNRYYTTTTGKEAANWLANHWQQLANNVSWASASPYDHSAWGQDSVILKIQGSDPSGEIIVLGAHLDSTAGQGTQEGTVAPGADDDASGIATLTHVAQLLLSSTEQPQRSIHIMGYAAEEVGLRGSKDIATAYKQSNEKVVAVLQIDMTNYQGSTQDIVFMTDYVNTDFTNYLKQLLDTYQPSVLYGTDRCGYACSDHASWYNQGYPSAMPFESRLNDSNPNIHSRYDTLANSDAEATNSLPFARLALSFAIEMANPSSNNDNQPPSANFTVNCNELQCQFDGASSSDSDGVIAQYQWSFGDNGTGTNQQVSHSYQAAGQYQVTLVVTDDKGATGQLTQQVTVTDGAVLPEVHIDVNCTLLSCQFDSSRSSNNVTSFAWSFGDGTSSNSAAPVHQYNADGSYTVTLTGTTAAGETASDTTTVTVSQGDSNCQGLDIWHVNTSYALGDEVQYDNKAYTATWWSTGARPDIYSNVWRLERDCGDSGTPTAPIAKFDYIINGLSVNFNNLSSDDSQIVSYDWQFGDGQSSQLLSPSHLYNTAGQYTVTLTVTDDDNLSNTTSKTLTVSDDNGQCQTPAWQASSLYVRGNKVSHLGYEYTAQWWTRGDDPANNSGPWNVWRNNGRCQ